MKYKIIVDHYITYIQKKQKAIINERRLFYTVVVMPFVVCCCLLSYYFGGCEVPEVFAVPKRDSDTVSQRFRVEDPDGSLGEDLCFQLSFSLSVESQRNR